MKSVSETLFLILLSLLPLLGGENYLYHLSPVWGKGILILTVTFVFFFRFFFTGKDAQILIFPGVDGLFLAFLVILTISSIFSISRAESYVTLLEIFGSLLFGIFARHIVKGLEDIEKVMKFILLSTIPIMAYTLYQSLWEFKKIAGTVASDITLGPIAKQFGFHRTPFATFLTSNAFACFLIMTIPLSFYFILEERGKKKTLWVSLFGFLSFSLFLSGSKGAVLTYLLIIVLMFIFLWKMNKVSLPSFAKTIFLAIGISFLMLLMIWRVELKPEGQNTLSNEISVFVPTSDKFSSSAEGRFQYWKTAIDVWKQWPVIGSGPGTFATISPRFQESAFFARHVHNDYLEILAETGLIGLGLFLMFNFFLWQKGVRAIQFYKDFSENSLLENERKKILFLFVSLFLGLAGFLIHNMIDFNWSILANRTLFFILFMLIMSLFKIITHLLMDKEDFNSVSVRVHKGYSFIGGFIILIIIGVSVPKVMLAEAYFDLASDPFENNLSREIEFGENAAESVPWNFKYHLFLAEAYRKSGIQSNQTSDIEKAMSEAQIALLMQPEISQTHAEMGILYLMKGNNILSEQEWKRAIANEKRRISLYNNLGRLYIQEHEWKKGESILDQGVSYEKEYIAANNPDMIEVIESHLLLGKIYEYLSETENAIKEYQKCLSFLKAYPNLNTYGHWNILHPGYGDNLGRFAKHRIDQLTGKTDKGLSGSTIQTVN